MTTKIRGTWVLLINRLLVDYGVLQYRCRHLAAGMQLGITEEFFRQNPSSVECCVCQGMRVWGRVLLPVSEGC